MTTPKTPRNNYAEKIPNLRKKIRLAMHYNDNSYDGNPTVLIELAKELNIDVKSFGKCKTVGITEKNFETIRNKYNIKEKKTWYLPLYDFGLSIGFQKYYVLNFLEIKSSNIDFVCREYNYNDVEECYRRLRGTYEIWHYSMSDKGKICVSNFFIDKIEKKEPGQRMDQDDGIITCKITNDSDNYAGFIFKLKNTNYFTALMESQTIKGEFIVFHINTSSLTDDIKYLHGISLGFDIISATPCSTKILLRKKSEDVPSEICICKLERNKILLDPGKVSTNIKNALEVNIKNINNVLCLDNSNNNFSLSVLRDEDFYF